MAAPDFFFAVNAMFRHLHDRHGMESLVNYRLALAVESLRRSVSRTG
jgi:hypothetical protein